MNPVTERIVGAAWNAGNCCLLGQPDAADAVAINTPSVVGFSAPSLPGGLHLPPAANANRPQARPVA